MLLSVCTGSRSWVWSFVVKYVYYYCFLLSVVFYYFFCCGHSPANVSVFLVRRIYNFSSGHRTLKSYITTTTTKSRFFLTWPRQIHLDSRMYNHKSLVFKWLLVLPVEKITSQDIIVILGVLVWATVDESRRQVLDVSNESSETIFWQWLHPSPIVLIGCWLRVHFNRKSRILKIGNTGNVKWTQQLWLRCYAACVTVECQNNNLFWQLLINSHTEKKVWSARRRFSLILKVSYAFNFGGGALCSHTGYKLESTLLNRIVPVKRFQRTGSPDCGSQVRKRKNVVQCNVRMKTFLLLFE